MIVLDTAKEQLEEQTKIINFSDKKTDIEDIFEVKGTTFAAAASGFGRGFEADDYDTYTVYTDEEPPHYDYAIGIRGDSMLPKYEQGDMLYIVDKGMSTYSGQLCIVVHNGNTYFKKVYTEDDGLRLVSLNKKYSDIFIDYPPAEDTYIKIYDVVGSFTPIEF
ncbi:S24 family peptidase [Streptococcus dysgalactiae]|nr:helix-turn-helix transcriptional regulator [Streptococcus dysgalactiae]VTT15812.1 cI-like repressor [Streptococcus dysgalactiae]